MKKFRQSGSAFKISLSVLLILFTSGSLFAQQFSIPEPQPLFKNYSLPNGFPSSETYFVLQDKNGYVWFATDRGIVRFNGYKFETFTIENGLSDNVIFRIYEDKKGRVWFISMNSKLSYYEKGRIVPFAGNDLMLKTIGIKRIIYKEFFELPDGTFFYAIKGYGYLTLNINGKVDASHYGYSEDRIDLKENEGRVYAFNTISYKSAFENIGKIIPLYDAHYKLITKVNGSHEVRATGDKNHTFLIADRLLFHIHKGKAVPVELKLPVIAVFLEGNDLFVGLGQGGVIHYKITPAGKLVKTDNFLNGYSVTSVCHDSEGGWWFTTLEQGSFYTSNLSVVHWSVDDLNMNGINSIAGLKNDVYVKNRNNRFIHLQAPYERNAPEVSLRIQNMVVLNNKMILPEYFDPSWNISRETAILINYSRCHSPVKNGVLIYTSRNKILRISNSGKIEELYAFDLRKHLSVYVYCILQTSSNSIFVGTDIGLFKLVNGEMIPYHHTDMLYKKAVTDLIEHPDLGIVASTKDFGIYFFRENLKRRKINISSGLLTNSINSLFKDKDNRIWISSHAGLTILEIRNNKLFTYKNVTIDNGLPSNEVSEVYVYGNKAWIATKEGVALMNIDQFLSNHRSGQIYPEYLETSSNKFINPKANLKFRSDEQYIKIAFGTTNFRSSALHKFRYRINTDGEWIYSDVPEIIINDPSAGDYNVELSFSFHGGYWSTPVLISRFTVPAPFYARWYFFALILLATVVIIIVSFRFRLKQVQNKHRLITTINDLEQKALSAQMNPHFIFNSLNSIQSFLMYGENEKAEKYLIKFSSLIRKTLTNSREKYIRIEQELSILNDYLELEKMRFPGKFTFEITSKLESRGLNYFIPPMLVQPYVENAVIHGISGLKKGGFIEIVFEQSDDKELLISIEDNGQGRLKSNQRKKSAHKSFGTTITQERLRFLTLNSGTSFRVEIVDKTENGLPCGTKIELRLPILENYESFDSTDN